MTYLFNTIVMSYKILIKAVPNDRTFICEAQMDFEQLKKDIDKIIKKDKRFVELILKSLAASRLMKDDPQRFLKLLKDRVLFHIEDTDEAFKYKRQGNFADMALVLAVTFSMQKTFAAYFFELMKEYAADFCMCSECLEKRKNDEETPEQTRDAIEELIKNYKNNN